ncbi:hypothetical protein AK830_g6239 [Neonectria ditissima]|uniref:Uncharacterized protein n=1 Tax=Neonectria ditissima TaxID=78410 RepID=A0A0P7BHB7_9HYPO|nr:hypothetical protein AK830_g6239 [Neonectria ditissima]
MGEATAICSTCARTQGLNLYSGRFIADSTVTRAKDGHSYCARHRCSHRDGCPEPRATVWHCYDHSQITTGAQSKAAPVPAASKAPEPKEWTCQVCASVFTDLDNTISPDSPAYCSRHRCKHPGCLNARGKNLSLPHAKWLRWTTGDVKTYNGTCHEHRMSDATASKPTPPTFMRCGTCQCMYTDTGSTEALHGISYCSRHRCTEPGCVRRREVDSCGVGWVCINHKVLSESPSQPVLYKRAPLREKAQLPPTTKDLPNEKRNCQACASRRIDNGIYNACSRHRCIQPGCTEPRVDLWVCKDHQEPKSIEEALGFPSKGTAVPATTPPPPPPMKKRHSRVQSLLNWRSRLQSRKDDNAVVVLETPPVSTGTETKQLPIEEPTNTQSIPTQEPLLPRGIEHPEVGWHQCHAPGCQDRVLSEDVWVCQKHLDQGHYDPDDPPGFVDCPAR